MALALALPAVAAAHPFADRVTVHQLRVAVTTEVVRLDYTVETPAVRATDGRGGLDLQTMEELANGFVVTLDGAPLALTPDPDAPPRTRASGHTVAMRLALIAALPTPPSGTLVVSNGNYPDLPAYFATEVRVPPRIRVRDSTLFVRGADGTLHDHAGAWAPGDVWRTIRLDLDARDDALHRAFERLTGARGTTRTAWSSRPRSVWTLWIHGGLSPGMALATLAVAGLLVLGAGPSRRGPRVAILGATALSVALTALLSTAALAWATAAAGAAAMGATALAARGGASHPAIALVLLALGLALGAPGLAALLPLILVVLFSWPSAAPGEALGLNANRTKAVLGTALVLGALAVARGLGTLGAPP